MTIPVDTILYLPLYYLVNNLVHLPNLTSSILHAHFIVWGDARWCIGSSSSILILDELWHLDAGHRGAQS